MIRFVAIIWNTQSTSEDDDARFIASRLRRNSTHWHTAIDGRGMLLFCTNQSDSHGAPIYLTHAKGAVIGSLFDRAKSPGEDAVTERFTAAQSASIVASHGRSLITEFWGRYLYFHVDEEANRQWILRDPTGRFPCQYLRLKNVFIFFSCADDVADLQLTYFSVNWPLIANQLVTHLVESRETGLNEVTNVLAGECYQIANGSYSTSHYWHPANFIDHEPLNDFGVASDQLRNTLTRCARSWAARHQSVLLRLSGGLDSAIVLATLQSMNDRPQLTCLNYFSQGYDSDERMYARAAARKANCTLLEIERNPRIDLRRMAQATRLAQPTHYPIRIELDDEEAEAIALNDVTAVFDGNGGDGIFFQHPLLDTASDFARDRGINRDLMRIAITVARSTNTSVWQVLRNALNQKFGRPHWNPLNSAIRHSSLVRENTRLNPSLIKSFLHPWFDNLGGVGSGKLWHVYAISLPLNFEDPRAPAGFPSEILPIFSQPVTELCLRIPTYVLTQNGWDRAVARRAFSEQVPDQILRRRSKGGRENHLRAIYMENIGFFRDSLLGGRLASEGLVDVKATEDALSGLPSTAGTALFELFTHLSIETWIRNWERNRQSGVAAA